MVKCPPELRRRRTPLAKLVGEWLIVFIFVSFAGCGSSEIKPVDVFPEDNCSNCRMAISDQSFASEIITTQNEILKFDDIGCLEQYRQQSDELDIAATFLMTYESKQWLPLEKSFIVKTGIKTPMGSGKVAFADSLKATECSLKYPVTAMTSSGHGCCLKESD
jgi:copper chaperone NosL